MEELLSSFKQGLPWKLLYADDVVLIAESEEKLKIRRVSMWCMYVGSVLIRISYQHPTYEVFRLCKVDT